MKSKKKRKKEENKERKEEEVTKPGMTLSVASSRDKFTRRAAAYLQLLSKRSLPVSLSLKYASLNRWKS